MISTLNTLTFSAQKTRGFDGKAIRTRLRGKAKFFYFMQFLGHRNIKNTLVYTQLMEFNAEEDYHVTTARTIKEACELVKAGFEYVTDIDDAKIFRKRK